MLAEQRGRLVSEDNEGREAFEAGKQTQLQLAQARSLLQEARSWSSWDTFGGGGLITDFAKHNKLDQVHRVLRQADLSLGVFSRELGDLNLSGLEALNLGIMTKAFDVWFDNIFSDWEVRNRIVDALQRVEQALGQTEPIMAALSTRGAQIAEQVRELDVRREQILLKR